MFNRVRSDANEFRPGLFVNRALLSIGISDTTDNGNLMPGLFPYTFACYDPRSVNLDQLHVRVSKLSDELKAFYTQVSQSFKSQTLQWFAFPVNVNGSYEICVMNTQTYIEFRKGNIEDLQIDGCISLIGESDLPFVDELSGYYSC